MRRIRRGTSGHSGIAALVVALSLGATLSQAAFAQTLAPADAQAPAASEATGAPAPAPVSQTEAAAGTPQASSEATAATTLSIPAPSNLRMTAGVESLAAQWSMTSTTGLASIRLRYRPVAVPAQKWSAPLELPPETRGYTLTGLAAQRYELLVRAVLAGGQLGGVQSAAGEPLAAEAPMEEKAPGAGLGEPNCALYAANAGSDSNPGTATAPFRSLKKLIGSLAAGQTGCLQSGQSFDAEADSTGRGSISIHGGESHGEAGAPVTITSTNPAQPALISHSLSIDGGADWLTFTHLKFLWSTGQCSWSALGAPSKCPVESHVQIAVSAKHTTFTYDDISNRDTNICINIVHYNGYAAYATVFEHDVIHDCGTPVRAYGETGYHAHINEEPGWHEHGIYDYGVHTTIRNNYLYNNSRAALMFYPSGSGAVVEHNVIDHNGVGVWLAGTANVLVRGNIVTNSYSPRGYMDYGIGTYNPGAGNVVEHNCVSGNPSGEMNLVSPVVAVENLLATNPLYVNAATHNYELAAGSPCAAYAPH